MSNQRVRPDFCVDCWAWSDKWGKCHSFTKLSRNCKGKMTDFYQYTEMLEACAIYSRDSNNRNDDRTAEQWIEAYEKANIPIPKEKMWMRELGLDQAYREDVNRGGGSHSEGSNKRRGIDKDNRARETIQTSRERNDYLDGIEEFERTHGERLPRLSRSLVSHSRVDSYTGDKI